MKKLLLSLIAFAFVSASFASENTFTKHNKRTFARTKAIEKFEKLNRSAATINVPTLTKTSYWDDFNMNWIGATALTETYANDRVVESYRLSYSATDTFGKYIYTYDANGRKSLVEYKNYDQMNHTFIDEGRMTYTYSANGSYVEYLERFDFGTNTWTPNYKSTYVYDDKGNQIKARFENYNVGIGWTVSYAYSSMIVYHNNSRKIAQQVDSNYNNNTMAMEASYGDTRFYNSSNQVIRIENYSYDNNVASLDEIDSIQYDGAGNPTTLTAFDPVTVEPMFRLENITWNGNFNPDVDLFENQPISYTEKAWMANAWIIQGRFSTSYPDNFGSIIRLEEIYDNNVYVLDSRFRSINDSHFNLMEEAEEQYDIVSNLWNIDYGYMYARQYDMNGNITEYISSQRNFSDTAYIYNEKIEYSNFINIASGLSNNQSTLETKLYPNPTADGKVNINLNLEKASNISVEIIDINGRIVNVQHEDLGQGLNTIELNGLNKGLYFVVITSDFGVSRTKLIVK